MGLRYITGTTNVDMLFNSSGEGGVDILSGFVDSDIIGSVDTRKLVTGYAFTRFGTTISWKSNL